MGSLHIARHVTLRAILASYCTAHDGLEQYGKYGKGGTFDPPTQVTINTNKHVHVQLKLLHTGWVSCLYHELFDDSVKDVTIVVAFASMHTKVLHCLRATGQEWREQMTTHTLFISWFHTTVAFIFTELMIHYGLFYDSK